MSELIDITGWQFEHCQAIRYVPHSKFSGASYIFRCECGKEFEAPSVSVRRGQIKSCGCVNRREIKEKATIHGYYKHPIYSALTHMKQRCYNPKCREYERYGGRGITVCDEWLENPINFINWSFTNGWEKGLTIDRIDNDGNYTPENCRWTTWKVNESNTVRNRYVIYQDEEITISEFARRIGRSPSFVRYRLVNQNMPVEKIAKWNTDEWGKINKEYSLPRKREKIAEAT